MTAPEERLERSMKTIGLIAGPTLGLLVYLLNPGGHPPEARKLLGIITLAVCYWMTEAIPLPATALLTSAIAITTRVAPAKEVLAPYSNPIIFLFAGTFLMAESFRKYGLDRRVAQKMLGFGFGRSATGLMSGFGVASAAISAAISNTATSALMTPIAVGAVRERGGVEGKRALPWASGVLLMIAYGASMGGMATLVGTPPNLLVAGFLNELTGIRVSFTGWLVFGAPVAMTLLLIALVWTRLAAGKAIGFVRTTVEQVAPAKTDDPAAARGAQFTLLAFCTAGTLWLVPGIARLVLGREAPLTQLLTTHLPEAGVALLCGSLLFVLPIDWRARRFTLTWNEGRQINYGILLLFGGGLSLGMLAQKTGLALWAGEGIQQSGLADTPAGLLAVSVAAAIIVSEFASNTASTTLLVPIVIAAAQASGFDPIRPALGVGLAATCGFIFPVSTPPNAIVFGTGLVPLWRMIKVGILLDVTSFFVVWLGMLLLTPLLPTI